MAVVKTLFSIIGLLIVTATLLVLIPGIPPEVSDELESFNIPPPKKLEGWFSTNTILDEAELYYNSPVAGVEAIAVVNDNEIYTGDANGSVIKITGKQVAETVGQLRYPCKVILERTTGARSPTTQTKCGWPLGMRFDKEGSLLVMDYYGGLTKINVKSGNYENIIPKSQPIAEKIALVPEDLDAANDGSIYWTDGSTTGDFHSEMLGQPSGRLIRYNPANRRNEVLLTNLYFSNGVCLSDDEEFVIVAESGRASIQKYYLRGKKKGQNETFVDGLPGYPDNIRSNGRGGFYVAIILPWNDQYSMKLHLLSTRPLLRKLILRSRHILLSIIGYITPYVPNNIYLELIEKYVQQGEPILNLNMGSMPKTAAVVELSKSGEVIGVLNGKSGKVSTLSHIVTGSKYAFLASPFEGKIWRIKLDVLRRMK